MALNSKKVNDFPCMCVNGKASRNAEIDPFIAFFFDAAVILDFEHLHWNVTTLRIISGAIFSKRQSR